MDRRKIVLRYLSIATLSIIWFLAVPYIFMVLYTVIEVQVSAKAAAGNESKLATFLVRSQAKQIDDQDNARMALSPQVEDAEDARDNANDAYFQACGDFVADTKLVGGEALGALLPATITADCTRAETVTAYYAQV